MLDIFIAWAQQFAGKSWGKGIEARVAEARSSSNPSARLDIDTPKTIARIGELIRFNKEYEVSEYAPGILLFGSDGGGEGYGFNTNEPGWPVVRLPFIGMAPEYADEVANSFENLTLELADE